ncbi:hypothetical protein Tco_1507528 [Tanacetum coccineum]
MKPPPRMHGNAVGMPYHVPETTGNGKRRETAGNAWETSPREVETFLQLGLKLQAETSAYEAKKTKEMAMIEFKEMTFLTIDADSLPEPKASIIRSRQEKIIAKYTQQ